MPRTSSKISNTPVDSAPRAIKVEKPNAWEAVQRFFKARETRMVLGIVLLTFSVIALLAYVSYLFTGTYDQSILSMDRPDRIANRLQIRNMLGLPGAMLAAFLIDGSFGFVSILLVLLVGIYALRLMHVLKDIPALKLFISGAFWVLWGSITLGFAHNMVHQLGVFLWGGAFGATCAQWLVGYVRELGTGLILLASLTIFLIVTDPRFIDRCKAFGAWVAGLFAKKPKAAPEVPETPEMPVEPEGEEVVVDIPIVEEPTEETKPEEVAFTIEPVTEEPEAAEEPLGDEPLPVEEPMEDEGDKDAKLEIQDVVEEELYDKDPDKLLEKLGPYDPRKDLEFFKFPSLNLLKVYDNENAPIIDQEEQRANGARIVTTLRNYGIEIDSIKATVGPTVTLYEIVPKAGIRVAKIQALENDIMMSLSATGIRIIAPMPGKGTIGIEVPNEKPQVVSMRSRR